MKTLCEYADNCNEYLMANWKINQDIGSEEDNIQIEEICMTDCRFYQTCYQNKRESEKDMGAVLSIPPRYFGRTHNI